MRLRSLLLTAYIAVPVALPIVSARAQQAWQLPRITYVTGGADTATLAMSDTAHRTKGMTFAAMRKRMISYLSTDTTFGRPVWNLSQTFPAVKVGSGSALAPGYGFSSTTDTVGIFRYGLDSLGVSCAGTFCGVMSQQGWQVKGSDGAAGDTARTGYVGEFASHGTALSSVSLSTGSAATIDSLSLTAGEWDVSGQVSYTSGGGATTINTMFCSLNTSATGISGNGTFTEVNWGATGLSVASENEVLCPNVHFRLTATTKIYLVGLSSFTTAVTYKAGGFIRAKRVH